MQVPHEMQQKIEFVESQRDRFVGLSREEARALADELGIRIRFADGGPLSADLRPDRLTLFQDSSTKVASSRRG
jgi:hypothetical protein